MSQKSNPLKTAKNKKIKKMQEGNRQPSKQTISNRSQDPRFSKVRNDPQFMAPSSKQIKTGIDKRFTKMLKDKQFSNISKIDRYGRTIDSKGINNELKQIYYVDEPGSNEESHISDQNEKVIDPNQGIRQWMQNYDQESSELEEIDVENFDDASQQLWEKESEHVIKGQNVKSTKRLALCNYDWMNINSKDLMILFNSFKPKSGIIKSIKVFMSNIGQQKLQKQQQQGPTGIWKQEPLKEEESDKKEWRKSWKQLLKQKQQTEEAFDQARLRSYERQRLKYFYAVIECDSPKTADQIYKECDGNQFQNSTVLFDLRFIPDSISFDSNSLKQECSQIPQSGQVKNFVNRALGHSKVSLSWEDPELSLAASLKKKNWSKLSEDDLNKIDWGAYIDENQIQEQDQIAKMSHVNRRQEEVISDWKKSCNKKYKGNQDEIQVTFAGGFDSQKYAQKDKEEEVPSLKKQKKSLKQRQKKRLQEKQKDRQKSELKLLIQDEQIEFTPNLEDERFPAVYKNPAFSLDPADPQFDYRRTGRIFAEAVRKNRDKHKQ